MFCKKVRSHKCGFDCWLLHFCRKIENSYACVIAVHCRICTTLCLAWISLYDACVVIYHWQNCLFDSPMYCPARVLPCLYSKRHRECMWGYNDLSHFLLYSYSGSKIVPREPHVAIIRLIVSATNRVAPLRFVSQSNCSVGITWSNVERVFFACYFLMFLPFHFFPFSAEKVLWETLPKTTAAKLAS